MWQAVFDLEFLLLGYFAKTHCRHGSAAEKNCEGDRTFDGGAVSLKASLYV